jgi:hypothetical protein
MTVRASARCRNARGFEQRDRRRWIRQDQYAGPQVVHLIVNGTDPGRILPMTFSRRAVAEMTRRVSRIAATLWVG